MQKNEKKQKIIAMIPARYASTRFPGKMLSLISGKTLIQRTYENAKRCSLLDDIVIATDDKRIFDHIQSFGGSAVMTCPNCPTGSDRIAEALKKSPQFDQVSIVVNIQGDEPCLDPHIIEQVIKILQNDPSAVMSTAIIKLDNQEDASNSSVVKCVIDSNHNALYFSRSLIPAGHGMTMKTGVTYYRHMGIYGFRRDFAVKYAELTPTPLQLAEDLEQLKVIEHGYRLKAAIVDNFSIGVDRIEDIQKVEHWLCKQNTSL